ncbi:MAG: serine protease Do, partial [Gammaproteobacteria bacterium]
LSRVGDWVIAIGNPFGLGGTTTTGIISARGRNINSGPFDDFIQIDAPINRGNSGGPLFNMRGEVIGINSAIYSPTGGSVGIGFAIPSDLAESVVDDLRDHGLVQRAWLGVQIQSVTKDIAASLQLNTAHGALVTDIVPDSPAAKSALKPGDVIVNFNGHEISKMRDLPIVVAQSDINRELKVLAFRNGKKISLDVRLDQAEVEKLAGTSHPEKPSLGLALAPISDEIRQRMKLSAATTGVLITNVKRNSPAAVKGLQPGDIIESIGSSIVSTPGDVVEMLDSARDNQEEAILLRINRRGADRYVALKLG